MKKNKKIITAAVAGVLAQGGLLANNTDAAKKGDIHCEGISTKWANDCGANGHSCANKAEKNFDGNEWISMTPADCKKIQAAVKDPAVKKYIELVQKRTVVATKRGMKF